MNSLVVELPPMSRVRTLLLIVSIQWSNGDKKNIPIGDDLVNRLRDAVGVVVKTDVTQHHGSGQDQSSGVGLVLALDVETDVTASRLENSNVTAHVASGNNTGTTDKTSTNV